MNEQLTFIDPPKCECGCGRPLPPKKKFATNPRKYATKECGQRMHNKRETEREREGKNILKLDGEYMPKSDREAEAIRLKRENPSVGAATVAFKLGMPKAKNTVKRWWIKAGLYFPKEKYDGVKNKGKGQRFAAARRRAEKAQKEAALKPMMIACIKGMRKGEALAAICRMNGFPEQVVRKAIEKKPYYKYLVGRNGKWNKIYLKSRERTSLVSSETKFVDLLQAGLVRDGIGHQREFRNGICKADLYIKGVCVIEAKVETRNKSVQVVLGQLLYHAKTLAVRPVAVFPSDCYLKPELRDLLTTNSIIVIDERQLIPTIHSAARLAHG